MVTRSHSHLPRTQAPGPAAAQLQIALKNNVGVNYFSDTVLLHSVFTENAPVDQVTASLPSLFVRPVIDTLCCRMRSLPSGSLSNQWRLPKCSKASMNSGRQSG